MRLRCWSSFLAILIAIPPAAVAEVTRAELDAWVASEVTIDPPAAGAVGPPCSSCSRALAIAPAFPRSGRAKHSGSICSSHAAERHLAVHYSHCTHLSEAGAERDRTRPAKRDETPSRKAAKATANRFGSMVR